MWYITVYVQPFDAPPQHGYVVYSSVWCSYSTFLYKSFSSLLSITSVQIWFNSVTNRLGPDHIAAEALNAHSFRPFYRFRRFRSRFFLQISFLTAKCDMQTRSRQRLFNRLRWLSSHKTWTYELFRCRFSLFLAPECLFQFRVCKQTPRCYYKPAL